MHIEKALKIIDDAKLIVERKKVSEMTPEEYEKDLEARRKRRELRKQRPANIPAANQPEKSKSDEELRRENARQIAKGYEDAEKKINAELDEIDRQCIEISNQYNQDKDHMARKALKVYKELEAKIESGNYLADIRTSQRASERLNKIQNNIRIVKNKINEGRKSRYMDPFRYLEISFVDHTSTGNRYLAKPNNDGRPMDEWGQPLRVYIWDLPDRFDSRNDKVSKSEFIKWLSRLKVKYTGKYKSGTRRNRITWDTYDVWADKYKLYAKDWEYDGTISFEDIFGKIEISSIRTNTGEKLV